MISEAKDRFSIGSLLDCRRMLATDSKVLNLIENHSRYGGISGHTWTILDWRSKFYSARVLCGLLGSVP